MTLLYLRVISVALWGVVALMLTPSVRRLIVGRFSKIDEYRTALFFTALLIAGRQIGWIVSPESDAVSVALLALTAALAVYVFMIVRQKGA